VFELLLGVEIGVPRSAARRLAKTTALIFAGRKLLKGGMGLRQIDAGGHLDSRWSWALLRAQIDPPRGRNH